MRAFNLIVAGLAVSAAMTLSATAQDKMQVRIGTEGAYPPFNYYDADGELHPVSGPRYQGVVHSDHVQALEDPGRLEVLATSDDGVIEAIFDPEHPFRIGVQWHPERTTDPAVGAGVFRDLLTAAEAFRTR